MLRDRPNRSEFVVTQWASPRYNKLTIGVESPSSLGLGDGAHGPIRRTYQALTADDTDASPDTHSSI